MTAPLPKGYACHVDDDLAHVGRHSGPKAGRLDPTPCTGKHKPAPQGASSTDLAKAGLRPRTAVRLLDPIATRGTAPAPPRSTTKARGPRAAWTDAERDRALEAMQLEGPAGGIAGAHRATGIPKGTLSRWAKEAGIDLGARARARTAAAGEAVAAKAAEVRITTVERLERILEQQLTTLALMGELEQRATARVLESPIRWESSIAGPVAVPCDYEAEEALGRLDLITRRIVKRDVVGAATRAIHDLQLLKGDATERGSIVVRFGIPRPSAELADAQAVDEADLGAPPP